MVTGLFAAMADTILEADVTDAIAVVNAEVRVVVATIDRPDVEARSAVLIAPIASVCGWLTAINWNLNRAPQPWWLCTVRPAISVPDPGWISPWPWQAAAAV